MAEKDSWYTKWLRNGRLSGLTFAIIFITYVAFTIAKLPAEQLMPLLLLSGGAFVGNLAIKKDQEDKALKSEIQELKEKVEQNESTQ